MTEIDDYANEIGIPLFSIGSTYLKIIKNNKYQNFTKTFQCEIRYIDIGSHYYDVLDRAKNRLILTQKHFLIKNRKKIGFMYHTPGLTINDRPDLMKILIHTTISGMKCT
jgi:hypothetical protein